MSKTIIIYDINAIPNEITLDDIVTQFNQDGLILWDSTRGQRPEVLKFEETTEIKTN